MTSVVVPEIDQQTANQLAPECDARDCTEEATYRLRMRRACSHRPTMALLCTAHADWYRVRLMDVVGLTAEFVCSDCDAPLTVSVEAL